MSEHTTLVNDAFRLCSLYQKRYGVFPVRIGVHVSQQDQMPDAISPSMKHSMTQEAIRFFVDEHAKQGKMYLYGADGKAATSTYLNACVFVPLAMLPEAIQAHYRNKAS